MRHDLELRLEPRPCPVCGSTDDSDVLAPSTVDLDRLDRSAFASRKRPELMHHRLVRCPSCDLVYATPAPDPESLAAAYREAEYDSAVEARWAARTYARVIDGLSGELARDAPALDVGAGDGAFLRRLLDAGFVDVAGVEPSDAPRRAAPPELRALIRPEVFAPGRFEPGRFGLVTCFQTLEHVPDPLELCREAKRLLRPHGVMVVVCHDRRSPVNRVLGRRSPILDVEHLQLFSTTSLRRLLERAGFGEIRIRHIANRYPLGYWLRLAPLPAVARRAGRALPGSGRALALPVTLRVGNLAAIARG